MKFCTHCGKELMDEAVICPGCGCSTQNKSQAAATQPREDDTVSVGLCILAALFPIFGLIYWPVKHSTTPKRARACGATALIAWGVSFVITMVAWSGIL